MPSLASLHHIDGRSRVEKSSCWACWRPRLLAILTPNIRLPNIVIIRDRDCGTILHDLAELHSELQPSKSVVVGLITSKEQQIRILLHQILNHRGTGPGVRLLLPDSDPTTIVSLSIGSLRYETIKRCLFTMTQSVIKILCCIPILDTKMR